MIPNDPNGAWYTSGLRLGTPAMTTLGMGAAEMHEIAGLIHDTLSAVEPTTTSKGAPSLAQYTLAADAAESVRKRAADLLAAFPLYPSLVL